MANIVESFTIRATNQVVRAGDCVLMPSLHGNDDDLSSVALVERMVTCHRRGGVVAQVRWYYRPEDTVKGRLDFCGEKLLFSDRLDTRSADTFQGKCVVHSLKQYMNLSKARLEDFFCRFGYSVASQSYAPKDVAVYCTCERPYNPDDTMIRCNDCMERFHPSCVGVDIQQPEDLDHFICTNNCPQENCSNELSHDHASSRNTKRKKINASRPTVILGIPRDSVPITKADVLKERSDDNFMATKLFIEKE